MADLFGPTFKGELRELMNKFHGEALKLSDQECCEKLKSHTATLSEAAAINPRVNIELANGIREALVKALGKPTSELQSSWLRAAVLYFVSNDDRDPDFESLTGFDDDAEVLNLCLEFCDLNDLVLNVEDF